jgi:hypothetical protein
VVCFNRLDTLAVADRLRDLRVPARVVCGATDRFQKLPYGDRLPWDLRRAAQRGGGDTAPTPLQYLLFGAAT